MGRIRSVKPELFTHDELFDAEEDTKLPIRLAFIGLFTVADREGRFKWKPRQLKIHVLPYDDLDFSRVLDVLVTRGFIEKYASGGNEYGFIKNFSTHQVINNREQESVLPDPNDCAVSEVVEDKPNSNESTPESRVIDACLTPLVQDQGEGKGRERKGRERKGKEGKDYSREREVFEFWQAELNHPRAQLNDADRKKITARLEKFSVDELKLAIRGCKASPFHQGANNDGKIYDDIDLIFRSYQKTNNFIRMASGPLSHPNVSVLTQKNAAAAAEAKAKLFGGEHEPV